MKKETVDLEKLSNYQLIKKYQLLERGRRRERLITHPIYLAVIVILLLLKNCSDKNNEAKIDALTQKVESLLNQNKYLENQLAKQKPVLEINQEGSVLYVSAVISDLKDDRPSNKTIHPIRVPYKVSVPVVDSSALKMLEDCKEAKNGLIVLLAEKDSLLNKMNELLKDTVLVCADKQYRQDSSVVLMKERFPLKSFLSDIPPSINYSHTYIEYLPNPYREKAEKNFWWSLALGSASVTSYGASELLGHPKFYDDGNNSDAQKKHNQILGLRISSGLLALATLYELQRTVHFHNMEGKFIVGPTKFGVVLYLDK